VCRIYRTNSTGRFAVASEDLFAVLVQDERQRLEIVAGGITGIEATAHVAIHWDKPTANVYFAVIW
jgi:hypothetical protein